MKKNRERKPGRPDGADDVINKYGTYEVQRTNGTESDFPQIAQGMSWQEKSRLIAAEELWRKREE